MDTSLASADIELYFSAQADGYGLVESPGSDSVVNSTPAEDYQVERAIYYNNTGLASYVSDSGWSTLETNVESYAAAKARVEDYIRGGTYGKLPCTFAIVRTEELKFQGLLDLYPGAAAAYSLRLLDKDYTGSAIRVRRATDNAEQDIGFDDNGDLDTTSLATFCSGTDGFVKTWYDQAGSNDATQSGTTLQPKIYDSATGVVTNDDNGLPVIQGVTDNYLNLSSDIIGSSDFSIYTASTRKSNDMLYGGNSPIYGVWAASSNLLRSRFANPNTEVNFSSTLPEDALFLSYFNRSGNNAELAANGETAATATLVSSNEFTAKYLLVGNGVVSFNYEGQIFECVFYDSDQSSNRTGIESNINDYYSIYP
jgi:hypothetical protein